MADEEKKRSFTTNLIWIFIALFFIAMVAGQISMYISPRVRTETATLYTATSSISFKGVYVRDETVLNYPVSGIISYTHPDGSKVAKNSVVALDYKNRNDITVKQQIEELNALRAVLSDAQSISGADSSQLESYSNQIADKHAQLLDAVESGNYSAISDIKKDMLSLRCKREIVKGSENGFGIRIAEIDTKIASLESNLTSEPDAITINRTGYFISKVDGFEGRLSTKGLADLTEQQIDAIVASEIPQDNPIGTIGKLISDYNWYLVAVLDTVKLGTVFEGAYVTLRIGSSQQNVKAQIKSLKKQEDGRSIAVFKCDMFLADFIDSRVTQAKLIMDDYTGIRIPHEAMHMVGDDVGVYVRDGIIASFKKIKILLSEQDFILAQDTSGESGYLSLYDSIILEGKDLHDGKTIG